MLLLIFRVFSLILFGSAARARREPRYASLTSAAEYAAVPTKTMRDWVRRGLLPGYRMGPRLVQVDLNDVDAMRRRIPAASPAHPVVESA